MAVREGREGVVCGALQLDHAARPFLALALFSPAFPLLPFDPAILSNKKETRWEALNRWATDYRKNYLLPLSPTWVLNIQNTVR